MDRIDYSRRVRAILNVAALSTNATHKISTKHGFVQRFKNEKAVSFSKNFLFELDNYMQEFMSFSASHHDLKCPIHAKYIFHSPILKKDGNINLRGGDLDNFIKLMQDVLFKAISIDDAYVTKIEASKEHSLLPKIEIELTMVHS